MKNEKQTNSNSKTLIKVVILAAGIFTVLLIMNVLARENDILGNREGNIVSGEDLVILKSDITETAKFYPYQLGDIKLEILAVMANDGSMRTAFNTCQVCFDSGRGYYVQEGNLLVCQNCGNVFQIEQVEKIKGGCNPVPITKENKIEDDTNIVISKDFIAANANLFLKWKK
jgi:hypothetical protein